MSDQARVIIVDIHNRRRAVLAQGLVRNGRNYYNMPKGSNIMEMAYNCTLEAGAQMYADRCTSEGSPDDQRPLWGENFLVIKETLDPILAMSRAGDAWWGQIYRNGINQRMLFNKFFAGKPITPTEFTQAFWLLTHSVANAVLSNELIEQIIRGHNEIRGRIANGTAVSDDGTLPPAGNMYDMVFSGELEHEAEVLAEKCSSRVRPSTSVAFNLKLFNDENVNLLSDKELVEIALKEWYAPVEKYGMHNENNIFTDLRLVTFANMVYYKNNVLGCAVNRCNTSSTRTPFIAVVICLYSCPFVVIAFAFATVWCCFFDQERPRIHVKKRLWKYQYSVPFMEHHSTSPEMRVKTTATVPYYRIQAVLMDFAQATFSSFDQDGKILPVQMDVEVEKNLGIGYPKNQPLSWPFHGYRSLSETMKTAIQVSTLTGTY
ncbi:SCP-like protein [Ancylostoma ceylanicum]|uniref:SCP-like protein n=1 Tax=Ancylostoma ceylanicum TaxID=53326 RepID=A0A0D6LK40_9BILA|nr:SCP-like protein [Ancylostoma ceylanicum]